ncbi:MAG TPA: hypothetical protein VFY41_01255 [Nitrososphaeraceae archaeon]|nr:hypothetical protein [Nitrososphaeraceae archaeon]
MCLYDNHQWECSSWLGQEIAIPNSLISTLLNENWINSESQHQKGFLEQMVRS